METYRLTHIPESFTESQVRDIFPACDQDLVVTPICIARSVYAKQRNEKVATVSFTEPPSFVQQFVIRDNDSNTQTKKESFLKQFIPTKDSVPQPQAKKRPLVAAFDCSLARLKVKVDAQTNAIVVDNKFEGLTPLVDAQEGEEVVDIIALTGLAGQAFSSWQHPDGQMWLRDNAPKDISGIRILLWGQTSRLIASDSHLNVQDLRDAFLDELMLLRRRHEDQARPLVLIGHSLGGIIIKAAFVKASQDKQYSHLHTTIHGLVFFGTPHEGMETGPWEALWGNSPPQNLIRDLKPGSSLLKELKEGFLRTGLGVDILSCFERQQTPTTIARETETGTIVSRDGPPVLYVPESSSCLNLPREQTIPVNANHLLLSRLSGAEGSVYHTIAAHLARMVGNARIVVGYRTRKHEIFEDLSRIKASLDRGMAELGDINVMVWAVANEFEKVSLAMLGTEINSFDISDITPFKAQLSSFDLSEESKIMERIRHYFQASELADLPLGSLLSKAERDSENLTSSLQNFATEVTPSLLDLRELLDRSQRSARPCFLERFIGSNAAKQLGMDFVAERQRDLEALQENLLEPTVGWFEEISPKSEHPKIGRYRPAVGADVQDIILEYREYAQNLSLNPDTTTLSDLQQRTQQLATRLSHATYKYADFPARSSVPESSMSVLRCIAWKHDVDKRRFVLMYDIPPQLQHRLSDESNPIRTLESLIEGVSAGKELIPLDQVYFIAYQITHTIFKLHTQGWVHKNINPSNVIFMEHGTTSNTNFIDQKPTQYPMPYLKGFEFSRKKDATSDRLQAPDPDNNVYRHPNRQGTPSENSSFTQLHDIYAVGTVLFELGRFKTIKAVVGPRSKLKPWDVRNKLVDEARTRIPNYLGTAFARCVVRCLQGEFGLQNDGKEKNSTLLAFAYRRLVVDELKRMAFAGGAFVR